MKSNAEHLASYCCPWCGRGDLEGGPVDITGDKAVQTVGCLDCNAEWQDVYQLKAYALLEEGDEQA